MAGNDAQTIQVQVFGIRKSADTRKALRFFSERRVKTHFVDVMERAPAPGELRRFVAYVLQRGRPVELALILPYLEDYRRDVARRRPELDY